MNEQARIKRLIKVLESGDRNKRAALRELAKYKDNPLAVRAIVSAFGDGSSRVKSLADSIVMELGEQASDLMLALLQHESWGIREAVISSESLPKICGTAAVEPLINVLKHDTDDRVRGEAALTLGKIESERALDILLACLDDVSGAVRSRAIIALGQIGDAKAIPKLTARLTDEEPWVRACAAMALGKIGDASSLELLQLALLRILTQMIEKPDRLIQHQEEKRQGEQKYREEAIRDRRRRYYREFDRRIRRSVGVD